MLSAWRSVGRVTVAELQFVLKKRVGVEELRVNEPGTFLAQDRAMRLENKGCLVFWVGLLFVDSGIKGFCWG